MLVLLTLLSVLKTSHSLRRHDAIVDARAMLLWILILPVASLNQSG